MNHEQIEFAYYIPKGDLEIAPREEFEEHMRLLGRLPQKPEAADAGGIEDKPESQST